MAFRVFGMLHTRTRRCFPSPGDVFQMIDKKQAVGTITPDLVAGKNRRMGQRGYLSAARIFEWLIEQELVGFDRLSSTCVYDCSRRNVNFHVSVAGGRSLFVKIGIDAEHQYSLRQEWEVIAGLRRLGRSCPTGLVPRTPVPVHLDEAAGIYVYEYIDQAQSVRGLLHGRNTQRLAAGIVAAGRQILNLGSTPLKDMLPGLKSATPLGFTFGRPKLQLAAEFSSATFEFLKLVQSSPVLLPVLERCNRLWAPTALCHFDIRIDNFLVTRRSKAFLLDFEFAGLGDEMWDFSCLVGQLLAVSVFAIDTKKPVNEVAFDERSLQNIEASFEALSEQVIRPLAFGKQCALKARLDSFVVAHILQLLYELTLVQAKLSRHVVLGLQLCENVARRPEMLTRFFA